MSIARQAPGGRARIDCCGIALCSVLIRPRALDVEKHERRPSWRTLWGR
jgi:hypothetical protein